MDTEDRVIENSKRITEILQFCQENRVIFEATDEQRNLYSLGLEQIVNGSSTDKKGLFRKMRGQLLAEFKLLQRGAAEMRVNCNYIFSFQYLGTILSFKSMLLTAAPDRFILTYRIEKKIYRHPVRKSNRLSIHNLDRVSAEIGNKVYQLINLSLGGVGVITHEPDIFQIGQELPVKLLSQTQIFEATGSVRHIAPLSDDGFICGVSLTYDDEKSIDHVQKFIHQTRQSRIHLFKMNLLLR